MSKQFTASNTTYRIQNRRGKVTRVENYRQIKEWVADNPFDPARTYTSQQLDWYATVATHGGDGVLDPHRMAHRLRREIYVTNGTPDPSVESGMYWRTHPQGRKFNSLERRRAKGAGFYVD